MAIARLPRKAGPPLAAAPASPARDGTAEQVGRVLYHVGVSQRRGKGVAEHIVSPINHESVLLAGRRRTALRRRAERCGPAEPPFGPKLIEATWLDSG